LPFGDIIFQERTFCFGFDIFNNLLTFLYFSKNMPFIPITINFFETSIGISNKYFKYFYLNVKVHISILKNIVSIYKNNFQLCKLLYE